MAARAGMANLIKQIRLLCNAGPTDYTINSVTYFTDDQLQDELDACLAIWLREELDPMPEYLNGSTIYKQYAIPEYIPPWLEEDGGGTGGWAIKDGTGVAKTINVDYTINYRQRVVVFAVDQKGARNWLDCRAYNIFQAAAQIWRQRAGMEMRSIDWQSNRTLIKASQRRDYCLQMAEEMDRKAGLQTGTAYRADEVYHDDGIQSGSGMWRSDRPL